MGDVSNNELFLENFVYHPDFFKEIFVNSPYLLVILNSKGEIISFNQKAKSFIFSEEQLLGKDWVEAVVEKDYRTEVESLLKDIVFSKKTYGFAENYLEYPVKTKAGYKKCAWSKIALKCIQSDEIIIMLTGEDISLKQIVEKGFLESELKFRSLFESTSDTVFNVDKDWTFVDLNNAGLSFLKINSEVLKQVKLTDFFAESKDRQFFVKIVQKHKSIKDYETHFVDVEGNNLYVIMNCNVIEDDSGNLIGYQGIIKDFTEKFKREESLKLLQKAVECSTGIVMITDSEGNIEQVNPIFEKITGYTINEVKGKNARILSSGKHDKDFFKNFWMTLNMGKTWEGEIINKRKNGELFTVKATVSPVFSKDGSIKHFISVSSDITKEKSLEKQIAQAVKMETVGRLAGGIAHDFNNLLTIINGYTTMVLDTIKDEGVRADLTEVLKAGEKAASLTRQILAFSRKQVAKPKIINVNEKISELKKMLKRLVGENIEFKTIFSPETPCVKIDPSQLEQIILNLVVNARDAMKQGGQITVETEVVYMDNEFAMSDFELISGEYAVIKVKDSGVGIPNDIIDKVFDPFFTTKKQGEGTGLGLSTVYGIVKQNNGAIRVESEEGKGTTFYIYLLKVETEDDNEISRLPERKMTFQGKTVLIVEDEEEVRDITYAMFEQMGFTVLVAKNGNEATFIAQNYSGNIDLLFVDVVLPKVSGKTVAEHIALIHKNVKVIYTSGYPEAQIRNSGIALEVVNFVSKPYSERDLYENVLKLFK